MGSVENCGLWAIMQRVVVIPYRRFGTTYRSHMMGPKRRYGITTTCCIIAQTTGVLKRLRGGSVYGYMCGVWYCQCTVPFCHLLAGLANHLQHWQSELTGI